MSYSLKFKEDTLEELGKPDSSLRILFKKNLAERLQSPRIPAARLSGHDLVSTLLAAGHKMTSQMESRGWIPPTGQRRV